MEELFVDFRRWFEGNEGSFHPSIALEPSASGVHVQVGLGYLAIDPNAELVSCPTRLMISYTHAQLSPALRLLAERKPETVFNEIIALRIFVVEQFLLQQESFWWFYIRTLPQPNDSFALHATPLFDDEDMKWLEKTNIGKATFLRKETWRNEFEDARRTLCIISPDLAENITWNLYLWAATVLSSRSFPVASPTHPDEDIPALVPGLDLLNHSPSADLSWDFEPDRYTIKTDKTLQPGSEVFNNYGPKSNEELMVGYGFCLPENPHDWFGLGFSQAVSDHIRETKRARCQPKPTVIGQRLRQDEHFALETRYRRPQTSSANNAQDTSHCEETVCEQHYLRLRKKPIKPNDTTESSSYEFSPGFLEHSSIALENAREQHGHRRRWYEGRSTLHFSATDDTCRNKLHVLASTTMLLEKSLLELQSYSEKKLSNPINERQRLAYMYRNGQSRILQITVRELHEDIRSLLNESPKNGILRLDHILQNGPRKLVKDFRNAIHVAIGTRNAKKIRDRGGEECAFTLWLLGVQQMFPNGIDVFNDETPFATQLKAWVPLLRQLYGMEGRCWPPGDSELYQTGASYCEALKVVVDKDPDSLYRLTVSPSYVGYYLNVARSESLRLPNPDATLEAEDDELVLFIDMPEAEIGE